MEAFKTHPRPHKMTPPRLTSASHSWSGSRFPGRLCSGRRERYCLQIPKMMDPVEGLVLFAERLEGVGAVPRLQEKGDSERDRTGARSLSPGWSPSPARTAMVQRCSLPWFPDFQQEFPFGKNVRGVYFGLSPHHSHPTTSNFFFFENLTKFLEGLEVFLF